MIGADFIILAIILMGVAGIALWIDRDIVKGPK
jgi:hypothetical protein